ncbi:MAG: PAS domain-containing protein [Acidobacteriia bacterium]|nr:PAS domain-containing protein [Terriglobia bacterium]MBV8903629.1 PAS domain-containing protein [Terriglobia bacterium]
MNDVFGSLLAAWPDWHWWVIAALVLAGGACVWQRDRYYKQEIARRHAAEELARLRADLLGSQNRALELIAKHAPLEEILDTLLRAVEARFPELLTSIILLEADRVHVRHIAAPSLPESYLQAIDGEAIGPSAGSCGTAAYRGEPVVVEDIASDPLWENYRAVALPYGLRACWSTPIFDEQKQVLGTFALYFRKPRKPDENHWRLIEAVTHTAAIAIIRHRESEALRASEERLRLAVSVGDVGIWEWDSKTDLLTWSDSMKKIFGWPIEEGTKINRVMFLNAVHPDDRPRLEAQGPDRGTERGDHKLEFRLLQPDGSERWVLGLGRRQYDAAGNPSRMIGVAIDITLLKHATEEIQRREAQLNTAQHIAQLGSFEWDVASNRVYRSAELCRIFGLTSEEFAPTFEAYLHRVHPEDRDRTRGIVEHAFRDCTPFAHEERIVRGDGAIRTLFSRGEWIVNEIGEPVKLVGTCQDITERKQIEERLQAAHDALAKELEERVRAEDQIRALSAVLINAQEEERSRVAREIHDDLSQQIAAASIALSNLKKRIPQESGELRQQSERIREKLTHLAEGLRRLSHDLHPAILQHGGLAAALEGYCSEISELGRIKASLETRGSFEGVPPAVSLCVFRVAQEALRNVVRHSKVAKAQVTLSHSDGFVRLTVSDDGVGFHVQTGTRSAGLGLISIKERARLVNGTVEIRSQPNRGTTVILSIPDRD